MKIKKFITYALKKLSHPKFLNGILRKLFFIQIKNFLKLCALYATVEARDI